METPMMSLRTLIPALTICFSVGASADEPSQSVKTALDRISADFIQAWNKQQPAAMAALFAANCLYVAPTGTYTGQAGVQQFYEMTFNTVHPSSDFARDTTNVQTLSDTLVMAAGHWSISRPAIQGFWSEVYERDGGSWVVRAHTHNISPPTLNK
jgi:uncharacterized protein (TIGR02246 family)